jgi:ankyrin repeat protein
MDMLDSLALATHLLDHGAEVNARLTQTPPKEGGYDYSYLNLAGATPFLLAARESDVPMMRLLIARGADPKIPTVEHTSPMLAAAGVGYIEGQILTTDEQALEAVKMLVEQLGANVNDTNDALETPLHGTAYRGATQVAKYLIEHGATIDAKDNKGRMPVNVADGAIVGPYFRAHDQTAALFREVMGPNAPPRPTSQGAR